MAPSRVISLSLVALVAAPLAGAGELSIHFMNVDQGNGAFIVGPNGTRVLIDAGEVGKGSGVVLPYLQSIGVTDLDYAINTHWDLDHYGGMPELFNAGYKPNVQVWDVGNALMPGGGVASQYASATTGLRHTPAVGEQIDLGDGAFLECIAVNGHTPSGSVGISASTQIDNSSSIAVVIRYRDFDAYIGGDLTSGGNGTADVELPASSYAGQVEVAMASHHGSKTSSKASVVSNLSPSFVVQSAGNANPFFHPTKTVINNWNTPGSCRVQWCTTEGDTANGSGSFTAINGHIVVRTDGLRFTVDRSNGVESLQFTTWENPGPAPLGLSLRVSEVLVNPAAVADSVGEWFELLNASLAGPVDLAGVQISSGSQAFTIASHILLDHGDRIVVGLEGRRSVNGDVFTHLGAPWENFSMSNGSSSLIVRTPSGATLEAVNWGSGGFPVVSGASAEREDVFVGTSAGNFTTASGAWSGGDLGTPNEVNAADVTNWPVVLVVDPPPLIGGELTFKMHALDEPLNYYLLGAAQGFLPGLNVFGLHWDLNLDPVLLTFLNFPNVFALIDLEGQARVSYPIPNNPGLVGNSFWTEFLTLQFSFQTFSFEGVSKSNLTFFTIQ